MERVSRRDAPVKMSVKKDVSPTKSTLTAIIPTAVRALLLSGRVAKPTHATNHPITSAIIVRATSPPTVHAAIAHARTIVNSPVTITAFHVLETPLSQRHPLSGGAG